MSMVAPHKALLAFLLKLIAKASHFLILLAGNTKGGRITVLLTSCLTGLELAV